MQPNSTPYRFIISGGGTGGHIYPAIAIANELKHRFPQAAIKFVGALGRMEMEKIPKAGYDIVGLPIMGIQRRLTLKNLAVPFKLLQSLLIAKKLIKSFQPDVVIGVGGYASGPLLKSAVNAGVPALIQEQNSYAGLTNKLLATDVAKVCVAYDNMEAYFPKNKLVITGNPVRKDISESVIPKQEALAHFNLSPAKKTVLVIGGSLGARTINESMQHGVDQLVAAGYQLLWQTGAFYYESLKSLNGEGVVVRDFIYEMDQAYAAADVVVSRAGALSVSELCLVGKPIILVPSPNVAEDHQTKNAMALVKKDAAVLVKDTEAKEQLVAALLKLLADEEKQHTLSENIKQMAKPNATDEIVNEIEKLLKT